MPQVDFVTFKIIVIYFNFFLFLCFLMLNINIVSLLIIKKENIYFFEQIKFLIFFNRKFGFTNFLAEKRTSFKN